MKRTDRDEALAAFSNVRPGWSEIVERLDRRLSTLDARYEFVQVKQKAGGLRYIIQTSASPDELSHFEARFQIARAEADVDFDTRRVKRVLTRWWGRPTSD